MRKRIWSTEEVLYRFGLAAALVAVAGCLLWRWAPTWLHDWWESYSFCVVYRFTGFTCPGCGGTRALTALLRGRILESFLYHPLVLYGLVLYAWFMGSHTIEKVCGLLHRRGPVRRESEERVPIGEESRNRCLCARIRGLKWKNGYVVTAVILLTANFLIKNLIHLITGADVLAVLGQWFS